MLCHGWVYGGVVGLLDFRHVPPASPQFLPAMRAALCQPVNQWSEHGQTAGKSDLKCPKSIKSGEAAVPMTEEGD